AKRRQPKFADDIQQEIDSLRTKRIPAGHRLLSTACRRLAVNAEENNEYEEASRFRYLSMEVRRRERTGWRRPFSLSWWYWLASGYGERLLKAFFWLVFILFFWAILYTRATFEDPSGRPTHMSLSLGAAIVYSIQVAGLQKPDPKPITWRAKGLVTAETILGP